MDSKKEISYNLSSKIRQIFPQNELLESMCIVFSHCWSLRVLKYFRDNNFAKPKKSIG